MSKPSEEIEQRDEQKWISDYVDGWVKAREIIVDDIKDALSFSMSLTALATGSVGLIGVRAAFAIERTWFGPTVAWWSLLISTVLLFTSLILGLIGSDWGYRILRNYRTLHTLMRKQRILLIGKPVTNCDPLDLFVKMEKGEFLSVDRDKFLHHETSTTRLMRSIRGQTILIPLAIFLLILATIPAELGSSRESKGTQPSTSQGATP